MVQQSLTGRSLSDEGYKEHGRPVGLIIYSDVFKVLDNNSLIVWGDKSELWLLNNTACSIGKPSTQPVRRFECFSEQIQPGLFTMMRKKTLPFIGKKCIRGLDHYGNLTKYLCSSEN